MVSLVSIKSQAAAMAARWIAARSPLGSQQLAGAVTGSLGLRRIGEEDGVATEASRREQPGRQKTPCVVTP